METEVEGRDSGARPIVEGTIVIPARVEPFSSATAHVSLQDVSYADRGARTICTSVIGDLSHRRSPAPASATAESDPAGDTMVPFALYLAPESPPITARNDYAVRVWVDLDGDGRRSRGDLYSDQVYRVLTRGFGSKVNIVLEPR